MKSNEALLNYLKTSLETHFVDDKLALKNAPVTYESLTQLHQKALDHYQHDESSEAAFIFGMLLASDPFVYEYWIGLGACRQKLQEYSKALQAYAIASLLDDETPEPHYHAAQCFYMQNQKEEANKAINLAEALAAASVKFNLYLDVTKKFKLLLGSMDGTSHLQSIKP